MSSRGQWLLLLLGLSTPRLVVLLFRNSFRHSLFLDCFAISRQYTLDFGHFLRKVLFLVGSISQVSICCRNWSYTQYDFTLYQRGCQFGLAELRSGGQEYGLGR